MKRKVLGIILAAFMFGNMVNTYASETMTLDYDTFANETLPVEKDFLYTF